MNGKRAARWLAAIPAAVIAAATLPALPAAASQGSLCATFGTWCTGTPSGGIIGPGELAVNVGAPGRTVVFSPGSGGTGTLHSATQTGLCLAPASSSNLVIEWRDCSATGVTWTWATGPASHYFISQHYTGLRLSADNVKGDPLAACPAGGCSGTYTLQQWTGP